MFHRRTSAADQRFDQTLEHAIMDGRPDGDEATGIDDELGVARVLGAELAPFREVSPRVRERTWQAVQARITAREQTAFPGLLGDRLAKRAPRLVRRRVWVAAALALTIGLASPFGQQALADGWSHLKPVSLAPIAQPRQVMEAPDGARWSLSHPVPERLVTLPEAERQAGFTARLPRDLPADAQLVGAEAITQQSNTREEWHQLRIAYMIEGRTVTLVESPDGPAQPAPTNADGTPARRVQIGPIVGWLQDWSLDGYPGFTVIWKANGRAYWLSGPVAAEDLLRIARSVE